MAVDGSWKYGGVGAFDLSHSFSLLSVPASLWSDEHTPPAATATTAADTSSSVDDTDGMRLRDDSNAVAVALTAIGDAFPVNGDALACIPELSSVIAFPYAHFTGTSLRAGEPASGVRGDAR